MLLEIYLYWVTSTWWRAKKYIAWGCSLHCVSYFVQGIWARELTARMKGSTKLIDPSLPSMGQSREYVGKGRRSEGKMVVWVLDRTLKLREENGVMVDGVISREFGDWKQVTKTWAHGTLMSFWSSIFLVGFPWSIDKWNLFLVSKRGTLISLTKVLQNMLKL